MNVALVAARSAPYPGALERHVRELARGLAHHGAAVELLTLGHHTAAPALFEHLRHAARWFDLVHVHCAQPLVALAAARAHPGRVVFSPLAPVERLLRWPYGRATRAAVHLATATTCMSRSDAALLCRALPTAANRVRVVPAGVDMGAIRGTSQYPTVGTLVLTVGRLVRHKRIDRAIAAMAALVPAFELVVVGDGPARRRLKAFAAELQVSSRVSFAGHVSDADLHRWLKTARLVVALSEQEAFGLQVLEGLSAGRPVVASDIPAHREAAEHVGDGGVTFVSPEGSPLEVADAIRSALDAPTPPLISPLPSWEDVVERTLAVYDDVMRSPRVTGPRSPRFGMSQRLDERGRSGAAIEG